MDNAPRARHRRSSPAILTCAATFCLIFAATSIHSQQTTWTGATGSWFDAGNWSNGVPTPGTVAASVAVIDNSGTAQVIAPGAAAANQLLLGATINADTEAIEPSGSGSVIVNGTGATLTLRPNVPSLEVVQGTVTVENGGSLDTSSTAVGTVTPTGTPPPSPAESITIEGAGSKWTENGTLVIGTATGLPALATVTISDGASFVGAQPVTIGFAGQLEIGTGGLAGTFVAPSIINDGLISFNFTDSTTLTAAVSGTGFIQNIGPGTLTLAGINSYSGGTFVGDGIVVAAANSALGTSFVDVSGATSVLQINPGTSQTNFVTLSAGATLVNFGSLLAPATEGTSSTVTVSSDGTVTNESGGSIQNPNAGGVAIQGVTAASLDQVTITNAGTIAGTIGIQLLDGVAGNITNTSTGVITGTGGTAIDASAGGTVTFSNAGHINGSVILADLPNTVRLFTGGSIAGSLDLGSPTLASLIFDGAGTQLLSQAVTGTVTNFNSVTKQGTGTWTIDADLVYTGGTTISAGTLQLGNGGTIGSIPGNVTDNGILAFDRSDTVTFAGVISGTGAVSQNGAGTVTLTAANSYSGGTNFNAGILAVTSDGNLGTGALSFNGGTLEALAAGGGITSSKAVTLNAGGGTFLADSGTTSTLSGSINGVGSLTKNGTGTLILTGANTYSGDTNVALGTLQAGSSTALSANSAFSVISLLDLHGFNNTIGSLSGTGVVINNGGSPATLTVGGNNTNTTFSGSLTDGSNSLAFTKTGLGVMILAGGNTYTGGTTINAGTLEIGNGGTSGSIAGNINDNATVAFNRSDSVTFGGVISGTGALVQMGSGTLTLTADNSYGGSTTINTGSTLQLGNGGTTGSIVGNVTDNGTLALNRSDTVTFGGVVSGAGNLVQLGTGTTILTGNNTYTGSTKINAGTLQIGNGGTSGSIAGNVSDNATFAFNRSDSITFGGVISGTGALVQMGSGTLTLTADNSYGGGTTINTGSTLQLGNGGTTGSIVGNVTDNGSLKFNRSDNVTFNAIISGSGNLAQNGSGTTILGGANTYSGGTIINNGTLLVNNSQALGLGNVVVNGGVLGADPQPINVKGNYTQNAGGTLRVEIAGLAASQHDLLAVNGHASLAGTLQLIGVGGFTLHVGNQVTFLTANGGVSGTFGTVQNQIATGTLVKAQVVDLPNAVVLEGTQGSFVEGACNPNSVAVAQALDSAVGDPRGSTLIAFLDGEPLNKLCSDFTLIAPEELASIFNIGVSLANVQTANLIRRMEDIRAGSTGFSAAGFTLNGSTPSVSGGLAGVSGPEGKSGPSVMTPTPENRWGFWITGIGEFTNVDSTDNAAGYYLQTGGLTLGVDYRVSSFFAIGLTAGYAHTGADLANGGNLNVNGGTFGLYATAFGSGFYLDAAVTGGPSGYDTHRTALLGSANGSTDGGNLSVLVAAGYDWKKGGLSIGPTANFQYTYVGLSGFTESGSIAPLNFPDQNSESERTAFGIKASYEWKLGRVIIKPEISLAWQHEYGDQAYSIISSFASGAGNSFTVNGAQIGRDSLLVGAGAAVLLSERISIYAYYDGELGRTNYQSNSVSAGVRVTF